MGIYRTAQVCLNGHCITDSLERSPEMASQFCSDCGASTITSCPNCEANIRGDYYVEGVFGVFSYDPPRYCHCCGTAFPWTSAKISAAKELADELEELSSDDREKLKRAIDDLSTDSPRTDLAVFRYRNIVRKLGGFAANSLKSVVMDIITETAKKAIFGNGG